MLTALTLVLFLEGGLLAERAPEAGLLLGAATEALAPTLELAPMSVTQLELERQRLVATRPSVLAPVLLFAGGGTAFVVGLGAFLFASMVVGGLVMLAAVPLLGIGIALLVMSGPAREAHRSRVLEVDRFLKAARTAPRAPEPPPHPPGVWLPPSARGLVIAAF